MPKLKDSPLQIAPGQRRIEPDARKGEKIADGAPIQDAAAARMKA